MLDNTLYNVHDDILNEDHVTDADGLRDTLRTMFADGLDESMSGDDDGMTVAEYIDALVRWFNAGEPYGDLAVGLGLTIDVKDAE